ncbi:hypothetical protein TB2_018383 [Malus domestica]
MNASNMKQSIIICQQDYTNKQTASQYIRSIIHSNTFIHKPIDTIEKIGTDHSAPNTKVASRTMQDEGIGVEHEDPTATALKIPNVAENTMRKKVHVAATSSQHQGKAPSPNPIPIKIKMWFPSWVQVPAQIPDGGLIHMDCRMLNALIKEDYYPPPFIELEDEIPLDAVGSNGA